MRGKYKTLIAIILSFIIMFCVGCGQSNKTSKVNSNEHSNKTKIEKKVDEKSHEVKNKEKYNKSNENKKSEVKKENSKKDEEKVQSNAKENVLEEQDVKENNSVEEKKEIAVQNEEKSSWQSKEIVKPVEEDTFTMIMGRDVKGYTGKTSSVVEELTIKIDPKKSAMQYLRENTTMQENGGFIFEINGIHNHYPIPESEKTPEQKKNGVLGIDWFIYLNDKKTPVGANDVYPQKGDVLLFDFHEWDKREFLPPED